MTVKTAAAMLAHLLTCEEHKTLTVAGVPVAERHASWVSGIEARPGGSVHPVFMGFGAISSKKC